MGAIKHVMDFAGNKSDNNTEERLAKTQAASAENLQASEERIRLAEIDAQKQESSDFFKWMGDQMKSASDFFSNFFNGLGGAAAIGGAAAMGGAMYSKSANNQQSIGGEPPSKSVNDHRIGGEPPTKAAPLVRSPDSAKGMDSWQRDHAAVQRPTPTSLHHPGVKV
ncbi:MAG: hypothetical protein A3I66_12125 [Burkholderiales bacterium RIFCSPLOWO2_02_FULL_57_36]|nr:MAG: hypothetical protein A3I66_12125 [Burkholderiales bacterium RIFCSPLOWO2_02_FULL_57_36]